MTGNRHHIDLVEEQLWVEEAKKSTKGFEPIYNRYYDEIFRFVYRRTSDASLSDDLTSECFYKALKNINRFTFNGQSIGGWIYTIARNEVNRYYRNKKRQFIVEIDEFTQETGENEVNRYRMDDLAWVLGAINDEELMLIELKYFEHKTFKELAILMNMKESAVKMKLYRLLISMKTKIETKDGQK